MPSHVDNVMLRCINERYLLDSESVTKNQKIAIIGEKGAYAVDDSFARKLVDRYKLQRRNIYIFTGLNKFKAHRAKSFDLLIGIRPCEGEIEILKGATKYNKKFVLLPCVCGKLQVKVLKLIRDYPVIEKIEAYPAQLNDESYDSMAWIILYN
jgi:hypothetical protein